VIRAALLFALAVTIHNIEEAIWLPAFSRTVPGFGIDDASERFAITVLTIALWAIVGWAVRRRGGRTATTLLAGYTCGMLLNVFVPHVVGTLVLWRYVPGTASALLLNLPAGVWLLRTMRQSDALRPRSLRVIAPAGVVLLAASVPALQWVGGVMAQLSWR
jgi:hypothetical protein